MGALLTGWGWVWYWRVSAGLDNTPTTDNVASSLSQFLLLGRGPSPLSFRSRRVTCGRCPATQSRHLLRKVCLRLFQYHTAPVVRFVVAPTNATERLHRTGRAFTRNVRAPTRDAPRSVSAVTLRMAETLAVFALERALRCHECLNRHCQAAELCEVSYLRHLRALRHRNNEGVGGRFLAESYSRRPERTCITPCTLMSRDPTSSRTTL